MVRDGLRPPHHEAVGKPTYIGHLVLTALLRTCPRADVGESPWHMARRNRTTPSSSDFDARHRRRGRDERRQWHGFPPRSCGSHGPARRRRAASRRRHAYRNRRRHPSRSSRSPARTAARWFVSPGTSATDTCRCKLVGKKLADPLRSCDRGDDRRPARRPRRRDRSARSIPKVAPMPKAATDITMGITTATITIMADALLPLLVWLSPSFPTGAFAYSQSGLEWAVEVGDVHDRHVALCGMARRPRGAHGAMRADSIFYWASAFLPAPRGNRSGSLNRAGPRRCCQARRRTPAGDDHARQRVPPGRPRRLVGRAPAIADFARRRSPRADVAYPDRRRHGGPPHTASGPRPTLEVASRVAAIGNLVSAAVRLGPIGQSEAQAHHR